MRLLLPVLLCTALLSGGSRAADNDGVDVALVLLSDVSRSINDSEFDLEKSGYAAALGDPRVIASIQAGAAGRIAVAYVEFAGADEVQTVISWRTISDEAGARKLAADIIAAPRSYRGRTCIGSAVERATQLLTSSNLAATRNVIDVAGDGTSNGGVEPTVARDAAMEAGIIINGLVFINDKPSSFNSTHTHPPGGLAEYYRQNVIGGPGSFVQEVHDYFAFGDAMIRKLITEIAANPSVRG